MNRHHPKTTARYEKEREAFLKLLPATNTAYKRKWYEETGNPLLMLKGSSADKEDSLRNYNLKKYDRVMVYDFSRYELKEIILNNK